ncbi:FtsX-like permease family protein [Streptomyces sp. NRRL WC-3742]|uniref:FtsX-like permease family protein n=1 Tax=Streptomyces sp. NRRL WC-3742 TaxID=1463934 RepID=UPI0004CA2CF5|nr:FtsX-like permease family protein [Streptomyces sp. NRRL WC-3742]
MIAFALRLAVSGGREALARLATIMAAVAIGVGLLLSTFASVNAIGETNDRQHWMNTGAQSPAATSAANKLWWEARMDYYDGKNLFQVEVAADGAAAPVPPGLDRLPAPGEYYASPALQKLMGSVPAAELADRFPGHLAGTVGNAALPSPDSRTIVVGRTVDEVKALPEAVAVTSIATTTLEECEHGCFGEGVKGDAMVLILTVVAGALFFPVLIFIGTATRLSAAAREQRFAAMRLVGATPAQISVVAAVESTVAAAVGTVAGFLLYFALRPLVADVPFTGQRFFLDDLGVSSLQAVAVALGVPLATAVSARLALRRVVISPLGVSRRVTPKPPRAWRLIPLAAGLGELGWFVVHHPSTTNAQSLAYLSGFVLVMLGLVSAGPWLTMATAQLVARRTSRPGSLIAMRRLADDPKAGFRSVAGLVLALFVTSATVGIIGTINSERGASLSGDQMVRKSIVDASRSGWGNGIEAGSSEGTIASVSADVVAQARAVPGFEGLAIVHENPAGLGAVMRGRHRLFPALVRCSDLAQVPVVGQCAPGAAVAAVDRYQFVDLQSGAGKVWPAVPISAEEVDKLPVRALYATTDGSTSALERLRSLFARNYPSHEPRLADDWASAGQQRLQGWRQLANVVLLTTLPIAGCSLAVSVVAGLSDRRRPFAMLRLTGAPLQLLRKVVGLESAVPLLVVSAISIGAGFASAAMFLKSQMKYDLASPGAVYYGLTAFGIAASLGIIASTLPLLRRITGPEAARNG